MPAPSSQPLRAVLDAAVHTRAASQHGRIRLNIVGADETTFLVELSERSSRVCDDDGADADATLWVRKDDVPRLLEGWSLGGVRQAGRVELIEALITLLRPTLSPLGLRGGGADGKHRGH